MILSRGLNWLTVKVVEYIIFLEKLQSLICQKNCCLLFICIRSLFMKLLKTQTRFTDSNAQLMNN